jgi:hypothetical protein
MQTAIESPETLRSVFVLRDERAFDGRPGRVGAFEEAVKSLLKARLACEKLSAYMGGQWRSKTMNGADISTCWASYPITDGGGPCDVRRNR